MDLEEIFNILNSRCYEQGGGCYNCIFRPIEVKCLFLELYQMFGYTNTKEGLKRKEGER